MTGEQHGRAEAFTADQIRHVVDTAVNPFVLIDGSGTALWASASVEEILGIVAADLVGRSMLDLVAPASLDTAVQALARAVEDDEGTHAGPAAWEGVGPVLELVRADGATISCSIAVATPTRTGLPCFVLQLRRADAAHALENALLAMGSDRPLSEVLGAVAHVLRGELPDADVVILHHDRHRTHLSTAPPLPGECRDLDLTTEVGDAWTEAVARPGEVIERAVEDLPPTIRERARLAGYHWLVLLAVAPVIDDDPTTAAVLSVWSRATFRMHFLNHERVERCGHLMSMALRWEYGRRALQWAATHDGLTGLHNRAAFLTHLHAAGGARRRSSDKTAVLYLDLDDFKPVNDVHGHTLGDLVLVEVAERLRAAVRPSDIVARLGGDEFAVLCPGLDDLADAELLAQRLVAEISEPMRVDGIEVRIGLSVGIATLGASDDDAERVLNRADSALRGAKVEGKARWQVA